MCPVSIHAHVIRRWISMCKQKHVFVFQLCLMHWRRGRRRLTFVESTSQPLAHQARPSFHTIVHTSPLLLGVCQTRSSTFYRFHLFRGKYLRHRQKLPFLPPSFLVNPWPLLLHVTPGWIDGHAEMYLCRSDYLHCTQVDGWLVSKSSPAFFLHNSCFQNSSH